jgi:hypothetical protein
LKEQRHRQGAREGGDREKQKEIVKKKRRERRERRERRKRRKFKRKKKKKM